MKNNENNKNVLKSILQESSSYKEYEDIEKLVELSDDLTNVPAQPLYVSLLNASSDQVSSVLPKLSKEQRQCFIDLDFWVKDTLNIDGLQRWIEIYSKCQDDSILKEFVDSEDFLIYLKSVANLYTFDVEDPQYPDSDFYFLTDDSLLLIEYAPTYPYGNELKFLIRHFYDLHGVDKAYALLFRLINQSFISAQEELYQEKKERMREFGFVDYYEAREQLFAHQSKKALNRFIASKKKSTILPSIMHLNQSLHSSALISFEDGSDKIIRELEKVKDESRKMFLHFSFIRLINSIITLGNALQGGRVELLKLTKKTKTILNLGIDYIYHNIGESEDFVLFDQFDFFDVYKVGVGPIEIGLKSLRKAFLKEKFQGEDFKFFLGSWWNSFLDDSTLQITQVRNFEVRRHAMVVDSMETLIFWEKQLNCFLELLPYIGRFYQSIFELKKESKLNDQFYLNYTVDNIDFESLIISSFMNFCLNLESSENSLVSKIGLTPSEFKKFVSKNFIKKSGEYYIKDLDALSDVIERFSRQYGLSEVSSFSNYLYGVLSEHLNGYEFDTLSDDDLCHVGGPILLNTLSTQ